MGVVLPGFSVVEECVYDVEELRSVFPGNDCLVEVSLLLGNNTLRLEFHFIGDRFVAGDECVRTKSSGSGSLAGVLLSLDLVGFGVGVRCLVPRSGMVEVLAARCRERWLVGLWSFGGWICALMSLIAGDVRWSWVRGAWGVSPRRCSIMDVFYCGSNQSLGAMVLPLALVSPFSPNSGGGFVGDGGGRRAVVTTSTKTPCSAGWLSQQCFSLTSNQHQPFASQQYFSLTANQHQPPASRISCKIPRISL